MKSPLEHVVDDGAIVPMVLSFETRGEQTDLVGRRGEGWSTRKRMRVRQGIAVEWVGWVLVPFPRAKGGQCLRPGKAEPGRVLGSRVPNLRASRMRDAWIRWE